MHFSFIAMKRWKFRNHCDEAMNMRWKRVVLKANFSSKKPKFLWKVVISRISEPWNQKMPFPSLFITFLYINFVKKFDFHLKFSSKRTKILWKIVKSLNAMNFPFSLRWIFIARIFFIAMNSLLAYMYNWEVTLYIYTILAYGGFMHESLFYELHIHKDRFIHESLTYYLKIHEEPFM